MAVDCGAALFVEQHQIAIREIFLDGRTELAVYSEDRGIDFWRRLPSFQEA